MEINKYGVNKAISFSIFEDDEMRKLGFTDYGKTNWYFQKMIDFPNNIEYINWEISFSVTLPKDNNQANLQIDILDENFLQPYDYQRMLEENPTIKSALIVREQVEQWMEYLQEKGILHGHIKGEYI